MTVKGLCFLEFRLRLIDIYSVSVTVKRFTFYSHFIDGKPKAQKTPQSTVNPIVQRHARDDNAAFHGKIRNKYNVVHFL